MRYHSARSLRVSYLKHLAFLLASMLITLSVHATNLVTNPSFEVQPISQNWSVFGNVGALSSSSEAYSGTSSALLSNRTQSYGGAGSAKTSTAH